MEKEKLPQTNSPKEKIQSKKNEKQKTISLKNNVYLKIAIIFVLVLLLLIPTGMVINLIHERESVQIMNELHTFSYGKSVPVLDFEGNSTELWEPKDLEYEKIVEGKTK